VGDVPAAFERAIAGLSAAGLGNVKRSSIGSYPAVDCHPGTPDFSNMAIKGLWNGSVEELRSVCVKLEEAEGRPEKHDPAASRPLDIDIIVFGDSPIQTDTLSIPHPKALERLFVLEPMAEIAGDLTFPGTECRIREILLAVLSRSQRD